MKYIGKMKLYSVSLVPLEKAANPHCRVWLVDKPEDSVLQSEHDD